jgi:hypothetical protein
MTTEIPSETLASFEEASQVLPSDDALRSVNTLAKQQIQLEDDVAELELKLKTKKAELLSVSQTLLPGAMIEAGCSMFRLPDGSSIEIKDFVDASLPSRDKDPEKREKAFQWLDETGHNDIVKNEVKLLFTRGEDEVARRAFALLLQHGFVPQKDQTIHHQTLKAFIKEQLESGVNVPMDLFNAYLGRRAKIKRKDG